MCSELSAEEYRKIIDDCHMHVYESLDKNEVEKFFEQRKPEMFRTYTRRDFFTLQTVYVLEWRL